MSPPYQDRPTLASTPNQQRLCPSGSRVVVDREDRSHRLLQITSPSAPLIDVFRLDFLKCLIIRSRVRRLLPQFAEIQRMVQDVLSD